MRILVIDTETTGLDPKQDEVIEIAGVVCVDDVEVGCFSWVVRSEVPPPPAVCALTGLNPGVVARGLPLKRALQRLALVMEDVDVVVAWNASFDHEMVRAASTRAGVVLPARPWRCALTVARSALPERDGGYRLGVVAADLGVVVAGSAHRALVDVRLTLGVWRCLVPPSPSCAVDAPTGSGPSADAAVDDAAGDAAPVRVNPSASAADAPPSTGAASPGASLLRGLFT